MARAPGDVPEAMLRLALCAGVGPAFLHDAAAALGGWDAVAAADAGVLERVPGVGAVRAAAIRAQLDAADADRERAAMERAGVRAVLAGDVDYPPLMEMLPRMPPILWVRGDLGAIAVDSVGIVGVTCPPKSDPSAMRVPTGPGWALETLDETDTTHP